MKPRILSLFPAAAIIAPAILLAEIPDSIHYQGKVAVSGAPFDGNGQFKFALVDDGTENATTAQANAVLTGSFLTAVHVIDGGSGYVSPPTITITGGGGGGAAATATLTDGVVTGITVNVAGTGYTSPPTITIDSPPPTTMKTLWSNDGTGTSGGEPDTAVSLAVSQGVFSLGLGDTGIAGMSEPLTAETFGDGSLFLRVWFNDGGGFQQLIPDQPLHAVPYAQIANRAESVTAGVISSSQIDPKFALWSRDAASNTVSYYPSDFGGIRITAFSAPAGTVPEFDWSPMISMGHVDNDASGRGATVSGGGSEEGPNIASGNFSSIGGGFRNFAANWHATVGGGRRNSASAFASFVGGGSDNSAIGDLATVGGGGDNTAGGDFATVPGGLANQANGNYSFAAGRRAKVLSAHHGTFVWADNAEADFVSTGGKQFLIRANDGVGINTNSPATALHLGGLNISALDADGLRFENTAGNTWDLHTSSLFLRMNYNGSNVAYVNTGGAWVEVSDARLKTDISPVESVLSPITSLEVVSYQYTDREEQEHPQVGFLAQNVNEVFPHLAHRESEDGHWGVNYAGFSALAIRAIQEQQSIIESKADRIHELEERVSLLEQLETRLAHLESTLEAE